MKDSGWFKWSEVVKDPSRLVLPEHYRVGNIMVLGAYPPEAAGMFRPVLTKELGLVACHVNGGLSTNGVLFCNPANSVWRFQPDFCG